MDCIQVLQTRMQSDTALPERFRKIFIRTRVHSHGSPGHLPLPPARKDNQVQYQVRHVRMAGQAARRHLLHYKGSIDHRNSHHIVQHSQLHIPRGRAEISGRIRALHPAEEYRIRHIPLFKAIIIQIDTTWNAYFS